MMTNKMQYFNLFYLFLSSFTCFGRCFRPSSGALDYIHNFGYCPPMLLPAGVMDEMEIHGVPFHPRHQPAATSVDNIRNCEYSQVFPMMGENIAGNM